MNIRPALAGALSLALMALPADAANDAFAVNGAALSATAAGGYLPAFAAYFPNGLGTTANPLVFNCNSGCSGGGSGGGSGGTVTQGAAAAATGAWPVFLTQNGAANALANPIFVAPGSGSAWAITAASLPLPAGAATAANQPSLNGDGGSLAHVTNWPPTQAVSGNIGGYDYQTAPVAPTIQNAAYAASNVIGGLQTVAAFRTTAQPAGKLDQFMLNWNGGETTPVTVYIFAKNPTSTTCADKTAFSLAPADQKYLVTPPFTLVAASAQGATQSFANYLLAASVRNQDTSATTNLYVCLVVGSSVTPVVGDLSFTISMEQN